MPSMDPVTAAQRVWKVYQTGRQVVKFARSVRNGHDYFQRQIKPHIPPAPNGLLGLITKRLRTGPLRLLA